jgi:hypothetical protein
MFVSVFIVYLTTLSAPQAKEASNDLKIINNAFEDRGNEAAMTKLNYFMI